MRGRTFGTKKTNKKVIHINLFAKEGITQYNAVEKLQDATIAKWPTTLNKRN